MQDNTTIPGGQ